MKALNILNAYVEKQQAQAQAASDSDVASEEETPPAKRKGGWPKGKKRGPRKPKSTSPEVSEESKGGEALVSSPEVSEESAVERRFKKLCSQLVPYRGPAESVEGEIVRTIDHMIYRLLDCGVHFADGEPAGPSVNYLKDSHLIPREVRDMFKDWAERYQKQDYSGQTDRDQLMKIAVDYIEGKESKKDYVKNPDFVEYD